jgi:hypothetical protein
MVLGDGCTGMLWIFNDTILVSASVAFVAFPNVIVPHEDNLTLEPSIL